MGGVPCIRGLRIPVATVVGMVADGMSRQEILAAYPDLEAEDIEQALGYAAEAVREGELPIAAGCGCCSTTRSPRSSHSGYQRPDTAPGYVPDHGIQPTSDEESSNTAESPVTPLARSYTGFMTLTVDLPEDAVARLQAEAKRRGVSIDVLIAELAEALPAGTPPATFSFIGLGSSTSGRYARDTDELLAEGFGRD